MSVEIGLISDVHAMAAPLREALSIFEQEGVDLILCPGDIAGYGTELSRCVELLMAKDCTVISGNHDVWYGERHGEEQEGQVDEFLVDLPLTWEATLAGKRILVVHASPPFSMNRGITLLDQYGKIMRVEKEQWSSELEQYDLDILVVGHTHQVFVEMLGRTLVINPGSTLFNHTCAILNLPDLDVRIIPLSGKTPRKVWHWGMMTSSGNGFTVG